MKLFFLLINFFIVLPVFSQSLPQTDTQFWNEFTVTKPVKKSKDSRGNIFTRVAVFFNGNLRFGNRIGALIDQRVGFGLDFTINKYLTLTPSYLYRSNRPSLSKREYESRFRFAATLEKKWKLFSIKDRNLIEYRLRNSKADSTRYRNKITLSIPILKNKAEILAPFVADEPYYDFRAKNWSRNELTIGINRKLGKKMSADIFYLRQDNRSGTPKSINAIGMGLKVKLD